MPHTADHLLPRLEVGWWAGLPICLQAFDTKWSRCSKAELLPGWINLRRAACCKLQGDPTRQMSWLVHHRCKVCKEKL